MILANGVVEDLVRLADEFKHVLQPVAKANEYLLRLAKPLKIDG